MTLDQREDNMRMNFQRNLLIVGIFMMFVIIAGPVLAGTALEQSQPAMSLNQNLGSPGPSALDTYGTTDYIALWIPADDFQPRNSTITYDELYGYINRTGGTGFTGADFSASVKLPNGALVDLIRLFYCDTDAANNITMFFTRYYGETSGTDFEDIAILSPTGTPGCTSAYVNVNYTIANYDNSYHIIVRLGGATTSALRFKGARVWYRLQVSPAPASATFLDVPTSAGYFANVEALYDSGITAGCTTGYYCPDAPVTRAQMAVFLSKALGLHYGGFY